MLPSTLGCESFGSLELSLQVELGMFYSTSLGGQCVLAVIASRYELVEEKGFGGSTWWHESLSPSRFLAG